MIDPISVAIVATTVGGINAGVSLLQVKKQNEIKKEYKRMRIELGCFEAGCIIAIVAGVIDSRVTKKTLDALRNDDSLQYNDLMCRISALDQRINNLNLDALDAKLDMVVAATANPIIIPTEKPYTIHDDEKESKKTKKVEDITEVNIDKAFIDK
jgi:hypothetical protein